MLTDWFQMKREEREAEAAAEILFSEQLAGREYPSPANPAPPHCFSCFAEIEWKERVPADWTLGPFGQYEPGTWTKHVCKPKPKLVDWGLEQWRERQRQGEGKMTLQIGGKKVKL